MVPVVAGVGVRVTEVMGPSSGGAPFRGPAAMSGHSQPVVILRCGMVLPRPRLPTSVSPPPPGPGSGPGPRLQSFLGSKACQRAGGWAGLLPCGSSCCSLVETILAAVTCPVHLRSTSPRGAWVSSNRTACRVPAPCSVAPAPCSRLEYTRAQVRPQGPQPFPSSRSPSPLFSQAIGSELKAIAGHVCTCYLLGRRASGDAVCRLVVSSRCAHTGHTGPPTLSLAPIPLPPTRVGFAFWLPRSP